MDLRELDTPALLVDVDRLDRNIAAMAKSFAGSEVALRPHAKTSKCWEVARRQLDAGAVGMTCSTAAEVTWLRAHGVTDLLWANVPVGPGKVALAVEVARQGGLTVTLDSVEAARPLSTAAAEAGVTVPFLLEVNTGHARLGVEPDHAVAAAEAITALPGLRLRGVLTHEGHIAASADRTSLEEAGTAAGERLVAVGEALRLAGHPIDVVSVGSTPGATSAPFVAGVTEARPGTYAYHDANQVRLGSTTIDRCALTVLARVVSVQRDGRAIIDAGVKAMSSDTIAVAGSVGVAVDPAGVPLPGVTFAEANEEHGFLFHSGGFAVGDLVRLVPNHACGTTNMWSHAYAVRRTEVLAEWPIAARY
ncbi:alanine racemase [Actinophytocola oryzae]|uniref:D-serine deaminase-like pyridoxal phosphate-dependent protein n=1 Tax=Actinophytocola oryzae TaxID=502181 RepID=A0A4R7W676_9PSEU|nr:alanine racemase [Actinophytocola oryzae]TDV57785.1 D-serine deaminase-like pyridoxal phosphate-dependent protein [Actinophytocola oryzae]